MMFTPEELAAMRAADEEIDRTFEMTEDDLQLSRALTNRRGRSEASARRQNRARRSSARAPVPTRRSGTGRSTRKCWHTAAGTTPSAGIFRPKVDKIRAVWPEYGGET